MLDLNLIREKPDLVRTALKNRQMEFSPVEDILRLERILDQHGEEMRSIASRVSGDVEGASEDWVKVIIEEWKQVTLSVSDMASGL